MQKCKCGCGSFVQETTCEMCGILFYPLHSSKGLYCSNRCNGKARSGKNNPAWKGGKIKRTCKECGSSFETWPAELRRDSPDSANYCSKPCRATHLNRIAIENGTHNFFSDEISKFRKSPPSEEAKKLMSNTVKKKYAEGLINPFFGKNHTQESKLIMSRFHTGKIISKETRIKMSKASSGKNNARYGTKCSYPYNYKKYGVRRDLNIFLDRRGRLMSPDSSTMLILNGNMSQQGFSLMM